MFRKRLQLLLILASSLCAAESGAAEIVRYNGYEVFDDAVVAKLKEPAGAAGLAAMGLPAESIESIGESFPGLVVVERPPTAGLQALNAEEKAQELADWIEDLKASGQFEYVEPNFVRRLAVMPGDEAFVDGTLWGLHNFGQFGGVPEVDINATNAWDFSVGSTNVVVAVIDSGVRYTHRDLAAQMWVNPTELPGNGMDDDNDGYVDNIYGMDGFNDDGDPSDDNGHGTHVAGTIGASANDGNAHVGVAWNVRLMALKASDEDGLLPSIAIIRCWNFAVARGVQVINASYGGYGYSQAEFDAVRAARDAGILLVASAGNDRNDNDQFSPFPASFDLDNIISVAAMNRYGGLADFSNYGATTVDVAAPGVEIYSTFNGSDTQYEFLQGTSMAAPHVTGVAALVFSYLENASFAEVRERILAGVVVMPAFASDIATGGRVDAHLALTGGEDGNLEVSIVPAPNSFLTAGTNLVFLVRVSDGPPVTNATVRLIGAEETIEFLNTGEDPDAVADDSTYSAYFQVPITPGVINFTLEVTAPEKTNYTADISFEAVERPENDLFVNAQKVPAAGGVFEQTSQYATIEGGEPVHAGVGTADASVWFTWSVPTTSDVIIDTAGTAFDTVLAVYTGTELASLTEVVSVNDVGDKRQAYVIFRAQGGVAYHVAVAGTGATEAGQLRVRFEINGQPDTVIPVVTVTNPPSGFTVHQDRVDISGTAYDPQPNASGVRDVIVRVNDGLGVQAAGTTNWFITSLLMEGLNVVRVTAFDFAENASAEQQMTIYYRPLETGNDLFGRAEVLTGESGEITGDNSLAAKEFQEPNHAGNLGGKSVWYAYKPAADGVLVVSSAGSTFDTLLAVYQGARVSELTLLTSNDDISDESKQSEVSLGVQGGQTYYIALDGFNGATGTVELSYTLTTGANYPLTATSTEGGSVSPETGLFPLDASVSVRATPEPYWEFDSFRTPDGIVVSEQNPYTVVIRGPVNLVAHFRPREFTDDFESGNFNKLPYQVNGWAVSGDVVSTGQFAARSTAGRDQHRLTNSLVVVTNMLKGLGSFEYRVSTEPGADKLQFLVDGVLRGEWSGEVAWTTFEFEIVDSGLKKVEWRYVKDFAFSGGLDAVFIDNLDLPIGELPSTPPGVQIGLAGEARELTITAAPSQTVVVEGSTDLENWTTAAVLTADANGTVSYVDSSEEPYRFFRVRLQ